MMQLCDEDPEDDDVDLPVNCGHFDLEQAMTKGGDDRQNFFRGNQSDILYWWYVLDELQVITMTCVALKKGIGFTSDVRPTSIASMRAAKRRKTERKDAASMSTAIASMQNGIKNLDKTLQGMSKSMDDRAKAVDRRAREREITALKKEQIDLAEKLYVTHVDAPEQYQKMLRDRLD